MNTITYTSPDGLVEIVVMEIDKELPSEVTDVVIKRTEVQIMIRTRNEVTIIIAK